MYAHDYKKLWGLYGINLDDEWYLQGVPRTIFGCFRIHFSTKLSVTSSSYFLSNFPKGWDTFVKILYSSKIGEHDLTAVGHFFSHFIKIALFSRDDS